MTTSANYGANGGTITGVNPSVPQSGITGPGSNLGQYYQESINDNYGPAPGQLYNWQGPSAQSQTALGQQAMGQGAAQINTGGANPYLQGMQHNVAQEQGTASNLGALYGTIGGVDQGLTGIINGTAGPSVADLQLQQGEQANLSSQLAASRSSSGPGSALGAYGAAQAGANSNLATNQQEGIQRAQEVQTAQQELNQNLGLQNQVLGSQAGVYGQIAGQNLGEAGAQQGLGVSQAGLTQAQQQYNASLQQGYNQQAIGIGSQQAQQGEAQGNNFATSEGIKSGNSVAGQQINQQYVGAGVSAAGAVGSGIASGFSSDENAKSDIMAAGVTPAAPGSPTAPSIDSPNTGNVSVPDGSSVGTGGGAGDQGTPRSDPSAAPVKAPGPNAGGVAASTGQGSLAGAAAGTEFGPIGNVVGGVLGAVGGFIKGMFSDIGLKSDVSAAGANSGPLSNTVTTYGTDFNPSTGQAMTPQYGMNPGDPGFKPTVQSPTIGQGLAKGIGGVAQAGQGLEAGNSTTMGEAYSQMKPQLSAPGQSYAPPGTVRPTTMGITSDARLKVPTKGSGGTISDQALQAMTDSESTYRYKDPSDEPTVTPTGGQYLGVIAQRMESIPMIGKQIVKNTPNGKVLEIGPSLSMALAGLGRLNERLLGVEKRLGCGSYEARS